MSTNHSRRRFEVSSARLAYLVEKFQRERLPKWSKELRFFRRATREVALEHAGFAKGENGKRFRHQNRIPRLALTKAMRRLRRIEKQLVRIKTFDKLHDLIDQTVRSIDGIGELYVYDTALRLGAQLRLKPRRVYLHAGPREGARILRVPDYLSKHVVKRKLRPELHKLPAAAIEHFLCSMRREFHG